MAILPHSADYTAKDFDSIRERLIALIKSVFPTWTDFQTANFGNLLTELYAWVGDVLTFTQDNQARESRITTAQQRRNLLALVKLLAYTPEGASAATADLLISASGTLVNNVIIPAGQIFRTAVGDLPFQLLSPITLTPVAPSGTRTVENSTTETQVYAGNGLPNQSVLLTKIPSLSIVSVNDGSDYTEVENFLFSNSTDRHFVVSLDNNDQAKISFGDNVSGRAPTTNVTITYKIGGGAEGNVDVGAINKVDGTILDVLSNPVTLIVTNAAAAGGGADRETSASIRVRAPVSIRAPRTSIAREDFEIHAVEVEGVSRALMMTHEQDPVGILDNQGKLYIVPEGTSPSTPSIGLLDQVRKVFVGDTQARPAYPAPLTFKLTTVSANYLDIDVTATLYLRQGAVEAEVGEAVRLALANFFAPTVTDSDFAAEIGVEVGAQNPLIDFGYNLRNQSVADPIPAQGTVAISDVEDVVHDVAGVRKIGAAESEFLVNGQRLVDVALTDSQFPRLGTVTLFNGDTGLSF